MQRLAIVMIALALGSGCKRKRHVFADDEKSAASRREADMRASRVYFESFKPLVQMLSTHEHSAKSCPAEVIRQAKEVSTELLAIDLALLRALSERDYGAATVSFHRENGPVLSGVRSHGARYAPLNDDDSLSHWGSMSGTQKGSPLIAVFAPIAIRLPRMGANAFQGGYAVGWWSIADVAKASVVCDTMIEARSSEDVLYLTSPTSRRVRAEDGEAAVIEDLGGNLTLKSAAGFSELTGELSILTEMSARVRTFRAARETDRQLESGSSFPLP